MIISHLNGGLGNQMFQYAIGRVLSMVNSDDLYLDLTSYNSIFNSADTRRDFELDIFKLKYKVATKSQIMRLSDSNPFINILNQYLKLGLNPYPRGYIREKDHRFQPEILNNKGDLYLKGFWQSEKYFLSHKEQILQDFSFRYKPSKKNQSTLALIDGSVSVSIHVRRGDYVKNRVTNKYHGTCDIAYYQNAIKMIKAKCSKPTFFVFSDDIEWCKKILKIKSKAYYISHNHGKDSWEDMRLMSHCKHNIIANSSFCWWGAWLNKNTNKIVIAPINWFRDKTVISKDIVPTSWIKL